MAQQSWAAISARMSARRFFCAVSAAVWSVAARSFACLSSLALTFSSASSVVEGRQRPVVCLGVALRIPAVDERAYTEVGSPSPGRSRCRAGSADPARTRLEVPRCAQPRTLCSRLAISV